MSQKLGYLLSGLGQDIADYLSRAAFLLGVLDGEARLFSSRKQVTAVVVLVVVKVVVVIVVVVRRVGGARTQRA